MKIRILHLIPSLSGGGAERQLSYLAPELARRGHDVHIAYNREGLQMPQLPGVELHKINSSSNYHPYIVFKILQFIRKIKPDVIHTWILQMDILGGIATRLYNIPWILREPSSSMAYLPTWKNRLREKIASYASAIISNSHGGDKYWEYVYPKSKRYIISNALPLSEIEKVKAYYPPEIKDKEGPIILYVGRLTMTGSAEKNQKAFLETMAYIKQKKKILGIICGDGPHRNELEILSKKLGLESDVIFTGQLPIDSVWAFMKKANVYISLSAYEGCPNVVMEAMACGCPVILSDIPAHREILDESCAIFVDPSNIHQVGNTILNALDDINASKDRALIAQRKAKEWSISEMTNKYEKVYMDVI